MNHVFGYGGLSTPLPPSPSPRAAAVATDCDGTLTTDGTLRPSVLRARDLLREHQVPLVLVTGRAAGFAWTLFEILEADGVIAENGGVLYERKDPETPVWLSSHQDAEASHNAGDTASKPPQVWQKGYDLVGLLRTQGLLPSDWPLTHDCAFRFTDVTFPLVADTRALTPETLEAIRDFLNSQGVAFVYSTIHAHIMPKGQTKAAMLGHWAQRQKLRPQDILTIGDSLNDESLFEPGVFGPTWGVQNIAPYLSRMVHTPRHITRHAQGWGFCEMVATLIAGPDRGRAEELLGEMLSLDLNARAILFIDGECSLCDGLGKRIVGILKMREQREKRVRQQPRGDHALFRLGSLQGDTARRLLPSDLCSPAGATASTVVFWNQGRILTGPRAILALLRSLGGIYGLGARILSLFPVRGPLGLERFYGWVARHRYRWFRRRPAGSPLSAGTLCGREESHSQGEAPRRQWIVD